jgi:hypothetical protein
MLHCNCAALCCYILSTEQTGVTEAAVRDVIGFLKVPQCDPRAAAAPPLLKQGVASLANVVRNRCFVTAFITAL